MIFLFAANVRLMQGLTDEEKTWFLKVRQFLKCSLNKINNTLLRHKDTKQNSLRLAFQLYFNKQLNTRQ